MAASEEELEAAENAIEEQTSMCAIKEEEAGHRKMWRANEAAALTEAIRILKTSRDLDATIQSKKDKSMFFLQTLSVSTRKLLEKHGISVRNPIATLVRHIKDVQKNIKKEHSNWETQQKQCQNMYTKNLQDKDDTELRIQKGEDQVNAQTTFIDTAAETLESIATTLSEMATSKTKARENRIEEHKEYEKEAGDILANEKILIKAKTLIEDFYKTQAEANKEEEVYLPSLHFFDRNTHFGIFSIKIPISAAEMGIWVEKMGGDIPLFLVGLRLGLVEVRDQTDGRNSAISLVDPSRRRTGAFRVPAYKRAREARSASGVCSLAQRSRNRIIDARLNQKMNPKIKMHHTKAGLLTTKAVKFIAKANSNGGNNWKKIAEGTSLQAAKKKCASSILCGGVYFVGTDSAKAGSWYKVRPEANTAFDFQVYLFLVYATRNAHFDPSALRALGIHARLRRGGLHRPFTSSLSTEREGEEVRAPSAREQFCCECVVPFAVLRYRTESPAYIFPDRRRHHLRQGPRGHRRVRPRQGGPPGDAGKAFPGPVWRVGCGDAADPGLGGHEPRGAHCGAGE